MCHGNHPLNNCSNAPVCCGVLDEAPIQLHLVCRQIPQIAQAGEAGSEVVQSHSDTMVFEGLHQLDDMLSTVDQDTFSDFQFQQLGRQAGFFQNLEDVIQKSIANKLQR